MSKTFTPIKVGKNTLQHRIALAPLTRYRADDEHVPLPFVKDYYQQRGSFPGTLLVTEATFISPQAGGYPNVPGIHNAAQIKAWKEVTDAVHAKGSFIFCQLWALGRAAAAAVINAEGFDVVSASDIAFEGGDKPRPLTEEEIQEYFKEYAHAAKCAIEAGFDGVEVHGANGYLADQFLQDVSNTRTDRWGGSIENRARFALEATKAVIAAVGADKTAIRLSPWSPFQDMGMKDPKPQFSYLISALKELKLAYLHVIESRHAEEKIDFILDIWEKTSPVVTAGSLSVADGVLLEGRHANDAKAYVDKYPNSDIITAWGRFFIANPDLPFKLKNGLSLNHWDRTTFYTPKAKEGYVDIPFSEEFKKEFNIGA